MLTDRNDRAFCNSGNLQPQSKRSECESVRFNGVNTFNVPSRPKQTQLMFLADDDDVRTAFGAFFWGWLSDADDQQTAQMS